MHYSDAHASSAALNLQVQAGKGARSACTSVGGACVHRMSCPDETGRPISGAQEPVQVHDRPAHVPRPMVQPFTV